MPTPSTVRQWWPAAAMLTATMFVPTAIMLAKTSWRRNLLRCTDRSGEASPISTFGSVLSARFFCGMKPVCFSRCLPHVTRQCHTGRNSRNLIQNGVVMIIVITSKAVQRLVHKQHNAYLVSHGFSSPAIRCTWQPSSTATL